MTVLDELLLLTVMIHRMLVTIEALLEHVDRSERVKFSLELHDGCFCRVLFLIQPDPVGGIDMRVVPMILFMKPLLLTQLIVITLILIIAVIP